MTLIYLFNLLPVLLFARKEVHIKRSFPVQFLLGKFVSAKLLSSVWLKKIHKHGQNSEEKIGRIFVLAILLSELEFHKKINKWINEKIKNIKIKKKKQWEAFFQWQLLKMLNQIGLKTRLVFMFIIFPTIFLSV